MKKLLEQISKTYIFFKENIIIHIIANITLFTYLLFILFGCLSEFNLENALPNQFYKLSFSCVIFWYSGFAAIAVLPILFIIILILILFIKLTRNNFKITCQTLLKPNFLYNILWNAGIVLFCHACIINIIILVNIILSH